MNNMLIQLTYKMSSFCVKYSETNGFFNEALVLFIVIFVFTVDNMSHV